MNCKRYNGEQGEVGSAGVACQTEFTRQLTVYSIVDRYLGSDSHANGGQFVGRGDNPVKGQ